MKTSILKTLIVGSLLFFGTTTKANNPKNLESIHKASVNLDLSQFCNYLENGNPESVEGVYSSQDGRYVIALIKNDEKEHDFIGVVVAADNSYWTKGQIKFNFVLNDSNQLKGYYYDSLGNSQPINFAIDSDSLETDVLKKLDIETVKASTLACF